MPLNLFAYMNKIGLSIRPILLIWGSQVQDTLLLLVEFVPGSPWLNFSAALANSQLACLHPVGIVNSCVSLALKSPYGEWSIKHVLYCILKQ